MSTTDSTTSAAVERAAKGDTLPAAPGTNGYLALARPLDEIREIITDTLAGQDLTEFDLPRVKIPGSGGTTWMIPGPMGETAAETLEGIIVGFKRTRAYWPSSKVTNEPPACRSEDMVHGIGDPGGLCKTCPHNAFGSAEKGAGKACGEKEIWFLLQPESFLPLVLALPSMSLKGAKQYRVTLGSAGIRPATVITSISLRKQQGAEGPFGIAVPKMLRPLDPDEAAGALAYAAHLKPSFEAVADDVSRSAETDAEAATDNADIAA